jgi:hypothetical protein
MVSIYTVSGAESVTHNPLKSLRMWLREIWIISRNSAATVSLKHHLRTRPPTPRIITTSQSLPAYDMHNLIRHLYGLINKAPSYLSYFRYQRPWLHLCVLSWILLLILMEPNSSIKI